MCGIFGLVGQVEARAFDRAALSLRHRGPDGFGTHHDAEHDVHLAHCRLAIIDLSENGRQPLSNEDGSVWVTYNGEIYNFRELRDALSRRGHTFRSRSDTDVIVHAYEEWGPDCVKHFRGMFAFGLWDRSVSRLLLARDCIGIKPLYYGERHGRFIFASEPRAILALPFFGKEIDDPALVQYLLNGYAPPGESVWSGIRQVRPGETVTLDVGSRRVFRTQYWRMTPVEQTSEETVLERLDGLLKEVVRDHMVSDVPLGLFLSGGVDSSLVTSHAVAVSSRVSSFSVGFEGGRNELALARQTAEALGTEHSEETIGSSEFGQTRVVLDFMDEPLANDSLFPAYWLAKAVKKKATVALSGDGGDELFGGYEWYGQIENCRLRKRAAFRTYPLLRRLGLTASTWGIRSDKMGFYRLLQTPGLSLAEIRQLFPGIPRDAYPASESDTLTKFADRRFKGMHYWQCLDMNLFLPCSNLMYVDRASMANSLEVRVPFLDPRIVECALSLPQSMIRRQDLRKYALRVLLERRGLGHVARRPKAGFSCPIGVYHDTAQQLANIRGGCLAKSGLLDSRALDRLFPVSAAGALNTFAVFVLWILEEWFVRFGSGVGVPREVRGAT